MKGIVFGNTIESAKKQIREIIKNYEKAKIKIAPGRANYRESKSEIFCVFENGDVWRTAKASESSRGMACNIAYIDLEISKEIMLNIIFPCIKCSPWTGVHFYEVSSEFKYN